MEEKYLPYATLIVETARELTRKGVLSATGGNLSVRISAENTLAITPLNYDYMKMLPQDICLLSLDMQPLQVPRPPSVESGMHAAIYNARPDVNAILHTHQVYPSALALIGKPIPALFDEQVRFLGREVRILAYAPSGSDELRDTVAAGVGDHNNAYLMANHGALLLGCDMERAVHNAAVLEKCALAYLLALCSGEKVSELPEAARELAFARLRQDQKKYEGK